MSHLPRQGFKPDLSVRVNFLEAENRERVEAVQKERDKDRDHYSAITDGLIRERDDALAALSSLGAERDELKTNVMALRPFQSRWLEMSRERDVLEAENKRLREDFEHYEQIITRMTEEQDEDHELMTKYVRDIAQLIKERDEWIQVANIGIPKSKRLGGGPQHG